MKENLHQPMTSVSDASQRTIRAKLAGSINIGLGWILSIVAVNLWAMGLFFVMRFLSDYSKIISIEIAPIFIVLFLSVQFPGLLLFWHSTQHIRQSWTSNRIFRKYLKIGCWVTGAGFVVFLFLIVWLFYNVTKFN